MDALLSGEVDAIAFLRGGDVELFYPIEERSETCTNAGLNFVFGGCGKVRKFSAKTRTEVTAYWKRLRDNELALRLALMSLDVLEDDELRAEALAEVRVLCGNSDVLEHLRRTLHFRPVPSNADLTSVVQREESDAFSSLVREVARNQPRIKLLYDAWTSVSVEHFESQRHFSEYQQSAVEAGVFLSFVENLDNPSALNFALLHANRELRRYANSSRILREWLSPLRPERKSYLELQASSEVEFDDDDAPEEIENSHALYKSVLNQQRVVIAKLQANDLSTATKYLDELIDTQVAQGDSARAAKTLCRVAQEAKRLGMHSLQLEWAQRAAELNPEDAWAHGQTADALIEFLRLDEALNELQLAETFGDVFFAVTGRGRIARIQQRLDEAAAIFRRAIAEFPHQEDAHFAWAGLAETLREMGDLNQSRQVYEEAIKLFEYDVALRCGLASVLAELGHTDIALSEYDKALSFSNDSVPSNGKASVLKQLGRFDDALAQYDNVIERFPNDPVGFSGRADVLRSSERSHEALEAYDQIIEKFPHVPVAYSGRAETLKDLRRLDESLAAYTFARDKFPYEIRVATGLISTLRALGRHKEVLAEADAVIAKFPFDLFARMRRADALKLLGRTPDAIAAYQEIIQRSPNFAAARNGLIATLLFDGQLDKADALFPLGDPRTEEDWAAFRLRGNYLVRLKRHDEAIVHFRKGISKTPFAKQHRLMRRCLQALLLFSGGQPPVPQELHAPEPEDASNIIRLHVIAASGNMAGARGFYDRLSESPGNASNAELRDEIASAYNLIRRERRHDRFWIMQRELDGLMLEAA